MVRANGTNLRTACSYIDKGGTGKTTTIAHLGVALAEEGHDVLLIDLAGKQGDLGKLFGIDVDPEAWPNIATVFQPEWTQITEQLDDAFDKLVKETDEGPDLIPAHQGLDSLDVELETKYDNAEKYDRLQGILADHAADDYDVVLIDLPGMANNITYNGVWAAQHVVTPVEAGVFESKQADALTRDLSALTSAYDRRVGLTMLVPNKHDKRTTLGTEYLERYAEAYPDAIAPRPVPFSQDIRNAAESGQTAFALEEPSSTAEEAREAYRENARALYERMGEEPTLPEVREGGEVRA